MQITADFSVRRNQRLDAARALTATSLPACLSYSKLYTETNAHSRTRSLKSPLLMCHMMTFTSRIYLEVITSVQVECFKRTVKVTV